MLNDIGLLLDRCTAEFVKSNVEPGIDVRMDRIIPVTQLFRRNTFFQSPCFRCSSVLVCTADVHGLIPFQPAETGKYICRQHLNKVPQMGYVVYIRKGGCDESLLHNLPTIGRARSPVKDAELQWRDFMERFFRIKLFSACISYRQYMKSFCCCRQCMSLIYLTMDAVLGNLHYGTGFE